MMDFDGIASSALTIWSDDPAEAPADRFLAKLVPLTVQTGINLYHFDLTAEDAGDYSFEVIVRNTNLNCNGHRRLGEAPDQEFVRKHIVPSFVRARETATPVIDTVSARISKQYHLYDRIILPEKRAKGLASRWAVVFVLPRFVLPLPDKAPTISDIEQKILIHLMSGLQPKEIAPGLDLTRRSIEHRIQALKVKFDARNVTHLVALCIGAGLIAPPFTSHSLVLPAEADKEDQSA